MKRKLSMFFKEREVTDTITIKDLQEVFKYIKKNDTVVIPCNDHSLVFQYDSVELGATDGEWFHTVMSRMEDGVVVIPGMKDFLLETIDGWTGDLEDLYSKGLNQTHPLYLGS